jgi:hypothetical protein
MELDELFATVKSSLEDLGIKFEGHPENGRFNMLVQGNSGIWETSIRCEQSPDFVNVLCYAPLKPANEATSQVPSVLSGLNSGLRVGAFYQNPEGRVVLRMALPIIAGGDIKSQVKVIIGSAFDTMDQRLHVVSLSSSATTANKSFVAEMARTTQTNGQASLTETSRIELN